MSLIIKGLNMPKDTERVEIIFWHSIGEKDEYILQHNLDVEAVEIPTPHGRLIDKDFLMKWLEITEECKDCKSNNYGFCSKGADFVNACEAITTEAPTIIEAEE